MQIDYKSLNDTVTKNDIYKAKKQLNNSKTNNLSQSIIGFLVISAISPFLIMVVMISGSNGPSLNIGWVLFLIVILVALILIFNKYQTEKWTKIVKLIRFTKNNNLIYQPLIKSPFYNGMIFTLGDSRLASDSISRSDDEFQIANYQYSTGSGKNRHTVSYGFIRIKLDRNLPHMVLDSVKNNANLLGMSFSNLPLMINKDQRLSLEGDFDSYFRLYAPKEYERDALYVFTPDLMALFIDELGSFDAEIIDDYMYIYSNQPFNVTDESTLQRLFNIIDLVLSKAVDRLEKYSDFRLGIDDMGGVSAGGRRLKSSVSVVAIVLIVLYFIYQLLSVLN